MERGAHTHCLTKSARHTRRWNETISMHVVLFARVRLHFHVNLFINSMSSVRYACEITVITLGERERECARKQAREDRVRSQGVKCLANNDTFYSNIICWYGSAERRCFA